MEYGSYFKSLGYKYSKMYHKIIVTDFQRHAFPGQPKEHDGIIGPKTLGKIAYYNRDNFCPEVFKPIKPYIPYNDVEIEALLEKKLKGLGAVFNRCARENDFDVLHAIAHAALESGWGTSAIANRKNNIFGFAAYDSSPMASAKKFSSYRECIEIWSDWWNRYYLLPTGKYFNGNCEQGVNVRYATSPIAGINKAFFVKSFLRQLGK